MLPTSGPSTEAMQQSATPPGAAAIQLVDIDARVSRRLQETRRLRLFSEKDNEHFDGKTTGQ